MTNPNFRQTVLNRFVQVCIVLGMLAGVGLIVHVYVYEMPIVREFFQLDGKPQSFWVISGVIATLCILGGEYIAFELLRMMHTLDGDPFIERNVRSLKRMGFTAVVISLLGLSTLLLHPVPLAVIAAIPVAMCGLFSLVLSGVFAQAIAYKQENDLTV
ncbi:MAG TPA: DUF2975 domain-containing protein [Feifaniaceae bacterium]|nr:DUF2975 domain-containing protein [Feifaniaceae bacterium]